MAKKKCFVVMALLCCICLILLIFLYLHPIGVVLGPEREYVVIEEDHYAISSDYHYSDRGLFLGLASDGHGFPSQVYQIKNVSPKEYIYVMDGWEGQCYVHIPAEDLNIHIPCPCPFHQ